MNSKKLKSILLDILKKASLEEMNKIETSLRLNKELENNDNVELSKEDLYFLHENILIEMAKSLNIARNYQELNDDIQNEKNTFSKMYNRSSSFFDKDNFLFVFCTIKGENIYLKVRDLLIRGNYILGDNTKIEINSKIDENLKIDLYEIYRDESKFGKESYKEIKEFLERFNIKVEGVY